MLRQRAGHHASQLAAAIRPDHDAADVALDHRGPRSDRVQVVAGVGEEGAVAAVDPAAADEQRPRAVIDRGPLDRLPVEVKLGTGNKPIYNSRRWRYTRRRQLFNEPLCENGGCDRIATDVHHRQALQDGGEVWSLANLESLCHQHHAQISRAEQMQGWSVR
jgi:hypothetical protein